MPEISRFYGIVVYMFFNDHNLHVLNGDLPISKLKLVSAWAEIHKEELIKMWESKNFHKIEPLR